MSAGSQTGLTGSASWLRVRLGDVCEVTAGNSAPQNKELFKDGVFPFVRTSDVGQIHFGELSDTRDKLTELGVKKLHLFKAGSVLFPKSGASTFLNHRVLMTVDAYVASHLAVITPGNEVDSHYLLRILATVDARDLMQDTSYPALRATEIADIEFPLPPLSVQREIVARLERELAAVDRMETAFKAMAETADAEFKAELKETFEGLTAKNAKVTKLGEVCETISSRGHQIKQSEILKSGKYPVVSQSENDVEGYSNAEIPVERVPLVLFGDHTCVVKRIVKPFVVGADGTKLLRSDLFEYNFLFYYLLSFQTLLLDGEYRRHFGDLMERDVAMISIEAQSAIVARLDAARERCEKLKAAAEKGAATAGEMRKAILKEAFA